MPVVWFDLGAADWNYISFVLNFYEKLLKYLENFVDLIALGMDYKINCLLVSEFRSQETTN